MTTGQEPTLADWMLLKFWIWDVCDTNVRKYRMDGEASWTQMVTAIIPILSLLSPFSFLVARLGLAPGSPFNREAEAEQAQSTAGPAPDKGFPAEWSKPCFVLRARPKPR